MTAVTSEREVVLAVDGAVATLTLNRPAALNALGRRFADDLERALTELRATPGIRSVVVTGAGDRAFSVGGGIKERGAVEVVFDTIAPEVALPRFRRVD